MNHQELNPKMWKQLIEAKIKRDKNLTEVDMSAATDEFHYRKCKRIYALIISFKLVQQMNL